MSARRPSDLSTAMRLSRNWLVVLDYERRIGAWRNRLWPGVRQRLLDYLVEHRIERLADLTEADFRAIGQLWSVAEVQVRRLRVARLLELQAPWDATAAVAPQPPATPGDDHTTS